MSAFDSVSKEEKIAIMYLLNAISHADEKLDQHELDYISFYTEKHHLVLDEEVFKKLKLDKLCADIHSKKAKALAIEEVIKLAICDGNYHKSERLAAMMLGEMLNINQDKFLLIEKQIIEQQGA